MESGIHVTVGLARADIVGETNAVLQAAVDRVAALGGGVVEVRPGAYLMEDSLHLRSGVTVRGAGPETILRKAPSLQTPLSADLGYGHFDISVAEPDRLRVGMGIHIGDRDSGGFYDTVATLTWREGSRFGINRMLNHDYSRSREAMVTTVFPVISGCHLAGAAVENLAIDGNAGENAYLNGCRGGGIFLLQAHDVSLRDVLVHSFNGDGISFQQCLRTRIEGCELRGNTGHGLHPGSGSVAPVMRRCRCVDNGHDGIFYCLRVSYSLCEECEIAGSGHDGISIGGRDTHQVVRGNRITGSGRHGIAFRAADAAMGAHYNLIEGNCLAGNCRREGSAELFLDDVTLHAHLLGNRFGPGAPAAIHVGAGCRDIVIAGSEFDASYARQVEALCPADAVSYKPPAEPLPAGPECVPASGAWHLGE